MRTAVTKPFICSIICSILIACAASVEPRSLWFGNVEVLPGFVTPFEFELIHDEAKDQWSGSFQMVELMANGPINVVTVNDSLISIDLGDGFSLNGTISEDAKLFLGSFIIPGVLFDPIGINDFYWISLNGQTHTGGGLYLQPRHSLKIGQVVLDHGRWRGRQIVPEKWISESTQLFLNTSNPGEGYGYQWWRGSFKVSEMDHPYIFASGYGGQFLWIVPDLNLVAVALHHLPMEEQGQRIVSAKDMQDIILPQFMRH